ncbi:MAG: RdgB/HAM1 family non-canonical purine NTP pyrophosphatase [Rhodobacteraceae bacterium]|nr:RdgB/HAM1 family non-canonical purine NTP pyrophosphatase [Paracoccaceae bacterium]
MSTPRRFEEGRLVVASHNEGKLEEIRALLVPFGVVTVSVGELNLPVPEETETTFEGNARLKAHAAAKAAGAPALADDSGLMVEALDGAPGVYTADWAETPQGRDFNLAMRRVNDLLEDKQTPHPRGARFVSVLCLAWPDGHEELFRGEVMGALTWPPRGDLGHGYDPVFIRDGETQTFGELGAVAKNAGSHRSFAFQKLVAACFGPQSKS